LKTSEKILQVTQELLVSGGLGAVSFDAIGSALGLSKQAILYWYPSRQELLVAMLIEWLKAEAKVAAQSVVGVDTREEAITSFVEAIAKFHLGNLNRFRMMYLAPQTLKSGEQAAPDTNVLQKVHATTDRLYEALSIHLEGDRQCARQHAVAIHSAVLGLVLMFGLADGIHDPLKHSEDDLVASLVARLIC
jgi:AcrR family transcriptional regulator